MLIKAFMAVIAFILGANTTGETKCLQLWPICLLAIANSQQLALKQNNLSKHICPLITVPSHLS